MESIHTFLPILEGGLSIFNVFMIFSLRDLKQDIQREKEQNKKFISREENTNKELDKRLLKIELELAKRWSTWGR